MQEVSEEFIMQRAEKLNIDLQWHISMGGERVARNTVAFLRGRIRNMVQIVDRLSNERTKRN